MYIYLPRRRSKWVLNILLVFCRRTSSCCRSPEHALSLRYDFFRCQSHRWNAPSFSRSFLL